MRLDDLATRVRARWPLAAIVLVVAAVPLVRTLALVRSSSRLQHSDYWPMLDQMLAEDGGWDLSGVIASQNEHLIVAPKLLYLLNAELFSGSNQTLGVMVVMVVAVQVALVFWLALHTEGLTRWSVAAVTITASFFLYAPSGAWNFGKAMSGAAWLTANLLVLAALVAQQADRRFLAPILGVLATISYGTGLAVWPALLVVALMRYRRGALTQWPTFAAGAIALCSYTIWYAAQPPIIFDFERPSQMTRAQDSLELIGSTFASGSAAVFLGALAVLGIVTCFALLVRQHRTSPWIGLAIYGVGACALVSVARSGAFPALVASRYSSLSTLTWLALTALVLTLLPNRWWIALLPVPMVIVVTFGGQQAMDELEATRTTQDLQAIAMRTGLDFAPNVFGEPFPVFGDRLERQGHYPFDARFTADCGLLGRPVPAGGELPPGVRARVAAVAGDPAYPGAAGFRGVIAPASTQVDCVVVVDEDATIVGAGALYDAQSEDVLLFKTLSPPGEVAGIYARFSGSETFTRLDDPDQVLGS